MTAPTSSRPDRPDPATLAWRVSSFTGQQNCVEVADAGDGVAVRNSNHRDAGTIHVDRGHLADLLAGIKAGEYDDLAGLH